MNTLKEKINRAGDNTAMKALLFISLVFFLLRFIKITSYPAEYVNDEMYEIYAGALKYLGIHGFFSYVKNEIYGAAGSLINQMGSFFVPVIKEKVEYYRVISLFVNAVFLLGLYLFTFELFGRKAAVSAVFIASLSVWNYFNSRLYWSNIMVPPMAVLVLYFLIKTINKGYKYLIPAAVFFAAGFNAYIGYFTVFPAVLYILYEYYRSGEIGKQKFWGLEIFYLVCGTAAVYFMMLHTHMLPRIEVIFYGGNANIDRDLLGNLLNIIYLFRPAGFYPETFLVNWPVINPFEAVLLGAGLWAAIKNIREKEYRIVLVLLIVFMAPFFLNKEPHQLRVIQAQIPVFMLAGIAIERIYNINKRAWLAAVVALCLISAAGISVFFKSYEKQRPLDKISMNIAYYLNEKYGTNAGYLENIDFDEKRRTLTRLKSFYRKKNKPDFYSARFNALWGSFINHYLLKGGAADLRIFKSNLTNEFRRYPALLVTVGKETKAGYKLDEVNRIVGKVRAYILFRDFRESIEYVRGKYIPGPGNEVLNALLTSIEAELWLELNDFEKAASIYAGSVYYKEIPPDYLLKAAKCCNIAGNKEREQHYLEMYGKALAKIGAK